MYTEIEITPRFSETDANGHINNTVPPVWFEEGRAHLVNRTIKAPHRAVIARVAIDYLVELQYGHPVSVRTGVSRVGHKSYTYRQELWQGGKLCAKAEVVAVAFDHKARTSVVLPEASRAMLAQFHFDEQGEKTP